KEGAEEEACSDSDSHMWCVLLILLPRALSYLQCDWHVFLQTSPQIKPSLNVRRLSLGVLFHSLFLPFSVSFPPSLPLPIPPSLLLYLVLSPFLSLPPSLSLFLSPSLSL